MFLRHVVTLFSLCAVLYLPNLAAHSDGKIEVKNAWIREAPPNAKVLAAYLKLENHTAQAVKLIGTSSSAFERVEIHKTEQHGEMAHMVKQESALIKAESELSFAPGGLHLMLINPLRAIKAGDNIGLVLRFDNDKKLILTAKVKMAKGGDQAQHHHHQH